MLVKITITLTFILLSGIGCQSQFPEERQSTNDHVDISTKPSSTPSSDDIYDVDCSKTNPTSFEMAVCARQNTDKFIERLAMLLEELNSQMSTEQYERLLLIQDEWEKLTIKHCEWQADFFDGGSIQPTWHANCLGSQYRQRINELRINLCEGYGMSGECEESLRYKIEK